MTMEMEDAPHHQLNTNFHGSPAHHTPPIIIEDVSGTPLEDSAKEQTDFYNQILESTPSVVAEDVVLPVETKPDYDSMTREELVALAEKRGLRLTKGIRKPALVTLMREADKNSSNDYETGKGNGVTGNFERSGEGAPLDMVETDTLSMESSA